MRPLDRLTFPAQGFVVSKACHGAFLASLRMP
jgi:hypothetical protein